MKTKNGFYIKRQPAKSYQCQLCKTRVELYKCNLANYVCSKCHNKGTVIQITLANKSQLRRQAKATALLRRGVRNDGWTGLSSDRVKDLERYPDYFTPDEGIYRTVKRMIE